MVEAGRIDKYSHSLDWERAVYDTIMFDNVVKIAKDFAAKRNDTLIIVVPDHAHPVSIIGTYDDSKGEQLRDRLQTYCSSAISELSGARCRGLPGEGRRLAPPRHGVRRLSRLLRSWQALHGGREPADRGAALGQEGEKQPAVANEEYCKPGAARKIGNLPFTARNGVHAADDVVLTASGPGSEVFRGRVDNTFVFRAMARALGLGK